MDAVADCPRASSTTTQVVSQSSPNAKIQSMSKRAFREKKQFTILRSLPKISIEHFVTPFARHLLVSSTLNSRTTPRIDGMQMKNPWSHSNIHALNLRNYFIFNTDFSVKMFSFFVFRPKWTRMSRLHSFRCDDFTVSPLFVRLNIDRVSFLSSLVVVFRVHFNWK